MVDLTEQDLLTGLLHASAFGRRIDGMLATATEAEEPFALVVAELPPMADDGVLIEAARRLRDVTRSRDQVARSGPGELAVWCAGASEAEGRAVARRIAEVLAQPFEIDGEYLVMPIGIGAFLRERASHSDSSSFVLLAARAMIDYPF
jgi:GGDEF domain-containing protein